MALAVTHGASRDLGNNYRRFLVKIANASTAASLLAAGAAGKQRKVVSGVLYVSAACELEIRNASGVVLFYASPAGACAIPILSTDEVVSGTAEALTIEAGAAVTVRGQLDVSEEAAPSPG